MFTINNDIINKCLIKDINTLFITLTNTGYIDYTFNMLKSLENNDNIDKQIVIFCLDEESYNTFLTKGYNCILIKTQLSNFYGFWDNGFDKICYIKFLIIYKVIKLGYNCFYTDGDTFYMKNPINYIKNTKNIDADCWIQNDTLQENNYGNVCAGFMYVISNDITKQYFECESEESIKKYKDSGLEAPYDQSYFNKYIKSYINLQLFPLNLFPNGNYFYRNSNIIKNNLIMVHFNWVVGHDKKDKMKTYNMWLL